MQLSMNKVKKESLGILIASTNRGSLLDLIKCIKKDIFENDRVLIVFDGVNPDDIILDECESDSRIDATVDYPSQLGGFGIHMPYGESIPDFNSVFCMSELDYSKLYNDKGILIQDMKEIDYILFNNGGELHFAIREVSSGNVLFAINTGEKLQEGNTYPICLSIPEDKAWTANNITLI